MSETPLSTRWGIISTGKICHDFVRCLRTLYALRPELHKLIAVAASTEEKGLAFADAYKMPLVCRTYADMGTAPVDVVYIGGINTMHYKIAKEMLENGKAVLCEKPMCMNLKQTQELVDLAREKKVFLMEAVWTRFFPSYEQLKRSLKRKSIGEIHRLHISYGEEINQIPRIAKKELGGGLLLDFGVYLLQLVLLVFGDKPEKITTYGALNDEGLDDWSTTIMDFGEGKLAILNLHTRLPMKESAQIFGTEGKIEIKHPFWCATDIAVKGFLYKTGLPPSKFKFNFINSMGLSYEIKEVRRCLDEGLLESPHMTLEESVSIARLRDAILENMGVKYEI